jgi:hypothetical protein
VIKSPFKREKVIKAAFYLERATPQETNKTAFKYMIEKYVGKAAPNQQDQLKCLMFL